VTVAPQVVEVVWARRPRPIRYSTTIGGHVVLYGWALKETTGAAAAELDIYNGADASGDDVIPVVFSAGQSTRDWFGPQGLALSIGYFPVLVSGAIAGTVFIGDYLGDVT
jgi:hypothetical protein